MDNVMQQLVKFAVGTQFTDLPEDVVHETKRALLDSIGCAINGLSTDKGRIAAELARRLGGPQESTVIGTGDRVSCANAAFANGELINALDCDVICGGHSTPSVIPSPLALAESTHASGKDLILAIALGHEITARVTSALTGAFGGLMTTIGDGPGRGTIQWEKVYGYATSTFGAATGAGKILRLDQEKMAEAIGIAGYICPPNTFGKFMDSSPVTMAKYGILGWGAQAGVTSALLADMGFTGDTNVFDGEYCFWRYTGHQEWDTQRVVEGLGRDWKHKINYKQYPAGY